MAQSAVAADGVAPSEMQILLLLAALAAVPEPSPPVAWQDYSDAAFERAKAENRFVLLDLGAVWCHWCHVMEETTYKDPEVVRLIASRYVPIRVDQDARPDLSNRYEDYGWPATVVFDANRQELVKFAGYIAPPRMVSLLQAIIDDPTPGPSVHPQEDSPQGGGALLAPDLRAQLERDLVSRYDVEHGGWGFAKKFLDWDAVEYSLVRAQQGDADAARRARETLAGERKLVDPVWGGVYQYSHGGTWDNPHFEKIMSFQAECLRIYAQAYALWHDAADLAAAQAIHKFLSTFLKAPNGAFYTSQDADLVDGEHGGEYFAKGDTERRRLGIPRIDTHIYTRENGWAANALAGFSTATGDDAALREAIATMRVMLAERALPGGGFRHDVQDATGPYMGDNVAAARAFLTLYHVTGDREWLTRAEQTAAFIAERFVVDSEPGYVTAVPASAHDRPHAQRDENIMMARFANQLAQDTGKAEHRKLAQRAMAYLALPSVAARVEVGGVLLADLELHLVEVGIDRRRQGALP
jgi:uncharacterized protein YyaL (SSP411 family)